MFRTILARIRAKLYDTETGYLLNYVTLGVKNKQIQKEINNERN